MESKSNVIEQFRLHKTDTGSAAVQVALLTSRINSLTKHMQAFRKDISTKQGLMKMVSRRKCLLEYLRKTDNSRFLDVTERLRIRRKV